MKDHIPRDLERPILCCKDQFASTKAYSQNKSRGRLVNTTTMK